LDFFKNRVGRFPLVLMFVRSPSEQVRRLYYRFGSRALHPEIYRLHGCSHFRAFSVFVKASRVIELQVIAIHAPDVNRSSVRHALLRSAQRAGCRP